MQMNVVRVREKRRSKGRKLAINKWLMASIFAVIALAVTGWYDWYDGRLGIIGPQPVVESSPNGGRIIHVPSGGNVQAALNAAQSGDVVELQAGGLYSGTINLPNKPLTDFVTIRSSAAADLPAEKRVSPAQRSSMATITSGILGRPAVQAVNGAHHYRFVGIEFTASGKLFNYGVVVFGGRETRPENVPHTIEVDRSYIHATGPTVSRRGIALNSANTTIKNSYIEGFAFRSEETQGICGWSGTRNVKIINNYVEGGAENILFGGADPANGELIPTDIEISGNHLNKPRAWFKTATVKTLFELKNARRVAFTGNYLEHNWEGSAFRITVRNQDGGAPFSTIEDVIIRDNIIDGAGEGINVLGRDDTQPSQMAKRISILNNLFLNIGGPSYAGSGYFLQMSGGDDVTVANNTVLNEGNTVTFYGDQPQNLVIRDNIICHGNYGVHGLADLRSPDARRIFANNIIINNKHVARDDAAYPPDSIWLADIAAVGFDDPSGGNFSLSTNSRFKEKATDGGSIGCRTRSLPGGAVRSGVESSQ